MEQSREQREDEMTAVPHTQYFCGIIFQCGDVPNVITTTFSSLMNSHSFKSQQFRKGTSEKYSSYIKEFSMVSKGECLELELRVETDCVM